MSEFPIAIEPEVIEHFRRAKERKGDPEAVLRIGVKGGGCSGFEYLVRLDAAARPTDLVLQVDDLTIVCDPKSAELLSGSTLVYTGNLMSGAFEFKNPNAARSCGCGTSFMPKAN
jgi:iron-sulfur cluster assembly accessory protein